MIWALHGFLGQPGDWRPLQLADLSAVDLYEIQLPFFQWASEFNLRVQRNSAQKNVLLGYSMGGRLALHALADDPDLWDRVILISTHPGLKTQEEKQARAAADEEWARRFEQGTWQDLMAAWNSQAVLAAETLPPQRNEKDFDRRKLAYCLRKWSLAEQKDFRRLIKTHQEKIVWVTGERDGKFCHLAEELKADCPRLNWQCFEGIGHRILAEKPELLKALFCSKPLA